MLRHVGDDPCNLRKHPCRPVISRIKPPEQMRQLGDNYTRMIGQTSRKQALHPLGCAALQNVYIDAGIEQEL